MAHDKCAKCGLVAPEVNLHPSEYFMCRACAQYNDECIQNRELPDWKTFHARLSITRNPSASSNEPAAGQDAQPAIAPVSVDDGNLKSLADLASCDNPADVFINSLNFIYSYHAKDIESTLDKLQLNTLCTLYNALWDKMKSTFNDMKNSLPKKRKSKHTIIPDIYNFGMCIANGLISKEVDKIYIVKDSEPNATELEDPAQRPDISSLIKMVMDLQAKVTTLESGLTSVKRDNAQLHNELKSLRKAATPPVDTPATRSSSATVTDIVKEPATGTTVATSTESTSIRNEPHTPQSASGDSSDTEPSSDEDGNGSFHLPSHYAKKIRKLERRVTALTSQHNKPKVNSTKPSSTQASSSTDNRPRVAKEPHRPAKVTHNDNELYIGGELPVNAKDIPAYLKSLGIHSATKATTLSQKKEWCSYKVSLSSKDYDFALESCRWPTGIRIRPFQAKQRKSANYNRQNNNHKPSDSARRPNNYGRQQRANPVPSWREDEWPTPRQSRTAAGSSRSSWGRQRQADHTDWQHEHEQYPRQWSNAY